MSRDPNQEPNTNVDPSEDTSRANVDPSEGPAGAANVDPSEGPSSAQVDPSEDD
jgi:hypothetical protein